MEHLHNLRNKDQLVFGNLQPVVKGRCHLTPKVLSWLGRHIRIRFEEDLRLFRQLKGE
jgi:hypothetical protein